MRRCAAGLLIAGALVACGFKRNEGGSCDTDDDCSGKLVCQAGRCTVGAAIYRDMATQSGVPVKSERAVVSPGPGAVRVRTARGEDLAFAICADNERLVGGWCDPPGYGADHTGFTDQAVVGYTEYDTVGARWKCGYNGKSVRAYALCQLVEAPAPAPAASP